MQLHEGMAVRLVAVAVAVVEVANVDGPMLVGFDVAVGFGVALASEVGVTSPGVDVVVVLVSVGAVVALGDVTGNGSCGMVVVPWMVRQVVLEVVRFRVVFFVGRRGLVRPSSDPPTAMSV